MSSQGLYQHTWPPDRKFPDFSACRLHRQLVQKMKARSGLHRVSRQHAVAAEEVGGGQRLLARKLEDQQADGGSSGGDDQGVGVGFDDGAGRALIGALDGSRLVDDQIVEGPSRTGPWRSRWWSRGAMAAWRGRGCEWPGRAETNR